MLVYFIILPKKCRFKSDFEWIFQLIETSNVTLDPANSTFYNSHLFYPDSEANPFQFS
jgi:hypothetical protein